MFDFYLYPLYIKNSNEQQYLPGLRFQAAPKNASRNRSGDYLTMLVSPTGENQLPDERIQIILEKSMREYFLSSGTVTSGIRKIAEVINEAILEYNLKESPGGKQITILFNCAVVHGDRVYIGHSGYTHTFVLNKEQTEHFFDPEGSGRGLGLSRSVSIRFFLGEMHADEYILFSTEPLATWTPANLSGSPSSALEYLKRRLLNQVSPNVRALLIQLKQGSGRMALQSPLTNSPISNGSSQRQGNPTPPVQVNLDGKAIPVMAVAARAKPAGAPDPVPQSDTPPSTGETHSIPVQLLSSAAPGVPAKVIPRQKPDIEIEESELSYREAFMELTRDLSKTRQRINESATRFFSKFKKERKAPHPAAEIRMKKINTEKINRFAAFTKKTAARTVGATGNGVKLLFKKTGSAVNQTLDYITPDGGFKLPNLSMTAMILIAVAIPLIVVVAASSMYLTRGKSSQFNYYLNQAQTSASQTKNIKDPVELRTAWENILVDLDQAEEFGTSVEAEELRAQAQDVLDDIGGVARIEFTQAIVDGLPPSVNIVQIAASATDVYMLDSNSGQVLRAILTGKGFELDSSFSCAPGPYGSYMVDPFVDISLVPKGNSLNATLTALDGRGNIVYCGPGSMATSMTLTPPETGWGVVKAIAVDAGRLYIMDVESNSIWMYLGGIGAFINEPYNFFDKDVPPMKDAVDFSVSANDLYLLHSDGHLTTCVYSNISGAPTKCTDPAPYVITMNGGEKKPVVVPNTNFTQVQYSQPPDPSIYMLDSNGQSLYHFSLRMTLQKKLSMQAGDPFKLQGNPATAFAVNPSKVLFIAFGNKMYRGIEP